ncbi:MAG: response regulator [Treponema sp.]|nr:response regulator [Treponema sp.]
MNAKEVYVYAEFQNADIQQLEEQLRDFGYYVRSISNYESAQMAVEEEKSHVIIILTAHTELQQLITWSEQAQLVNAHLYFVGNLDELYPEKPSGFTKMPGVYFSGLPLDIQFLTEAIEYNRRDEKRILVVDDEPIMLRSAKVWLGDDFDVALVNSGETAISYLNVHPVDLVLLDHRMPGLSGPDVLKVLRRNEQTKNIPVIFLTARNDKESIVQVMALKPNGYILKSMSPEEIKESVVDFFKNRIITSGVDSL